MGNCASKRTNRSYQSSVKVSVPNLVYINRSNKTLLAVISYDISLVKLKQKVKVYKNSAVSYIDHETIIVAGGSDSSNSLTNRVFLINAYQKSIVELPSLPVPMKFGQFCRSYSHLYCLGGISESEDNSSCQLEESSPLMRFDFTSSTWEVFKHKHNRTAEHYLNRRIIHEEEKLRESIYFTECPKLKDLLFPAVGYWNGKIYIIGGKIATPGGFEVFDKVFAIHVEGQEFRIIEEPYVIPVKLSASTCFVKGGKGFIAGGLLENSMPNMEVFIVDFDEKTVKKLEIGIDRPLEEHYPINVEDKGILCYSPPKLLYVREDKSKIYQFSMPSQDTLNYLDLTLEKSSNEKKCSQKVMVDLSLVFCSRTEAPNHAVIEPLAMPKMLLDKVDENI
ncbi:hypothetical protein SteCoe_5519 [Stentor coeruleus]|uniref:Kelch motif family protein n=1 Tax=Stentor coeruleus TaxID=5963 RepID=A0A1R2CS70_9CILI|nr:hypothetical protein SteCoe_5519 [Stentor coeruleus]